MSTTLLCLNKFNLSHKPQICRSSWETYLPGRQITACRSIVPKPILGRISKTNVPLLTTSSRTIERVSSFKLLAVHVDSSMCWSIHINSIVKKLLLDSIFSNSKTEQDYPAVICYTTIPQSYDP